MSEQSPPFIVSTVDMRVYVCKSWDRVLIHDDVLHVHTFVRKDNGAMAYLNCTPMYRTGRAAFDRAVLIHHPTREIVRRVEASKKRAAKRAEDEGEALATSVAEVALCDDGAMETSD